MAQRAPGGRVGRGPGPAQGRGGGDAAAAAGGEAAGRGESDPAQGRGGFCQGARVTKYAFVSAEHGAWCGRAMLTCYRLPMIPGDVVAGHLEGNGMPRMIVIAVGFVLAAILPASARDD